MNKDENYSDEEEVFRREQENAEGDSQQAARPAKRARAKSSAPKKVKIAPVNYETARKRLIERHGYKEDELDTLYPPGQKDQELVDFYNKTLLNGVNRVGKNVEKEIGYDDDDDFDLPEEEKKRLGASAEQRALSDAERQQAGFKEDAKVSPEELLETQKSIKDLLNEDI